MAYKYVKNEDGRVFARENEQEEWCLVEKVNGGPEEISWLMDELESNEQLRIESIHDALAENGEEEKI